MGYSQQYDVGLSKKHVFFVSIHGNLNKDEMMIKSDTEPWDLGYPISEEPTAGGLSS